MFTISNNSGSDQMRSRKEQTCINFMPAIPQDMFLTPLLILRAWLLINLEEKRKVRGGCGGLQDPELVAASMSHALCDAGP